jgi:hypothetical protein
MTPLERITKRVNQAGDLNKGTTPRPMLTLEEFFEGNDVVGSIWCNCSPHPSPADAYAILKTVRSKAGVADVRVEVGMFDMPEWPFSEVVWVITDRSADEVQSWFPKAVAPDDIFVGWRDGVATEPVHVPKGMNAVGCWWD